MTTDDDGRDGNGRWKKGHCPNPNGRPRKAPAISDADVYHFKNTLVTANINGEPRQLTRQELLIHALFEKAIQGKNVMILRMLFARFEESDELIVKAKMTATDIGKQLVQGYRKTGEFDESLHDEYEHLRFLLSSGNPDRLVRKPRRSRVKRRPSPVASWRKGPKPQSLLDLERKEEAEFLAEAKERARRLGLPIEDEADEDDGPVDF